MSIKYHTDKTRRRISRTMKRKGLAPPSRKGVKHTSYTKQLIKKQVAKRKRNSNGTFKQLT